MSEASWIVEGSAGQTLAAGRGESILVCTDDAARGFDPEGAALTSKSAWEIWLRAGASLVEQLPVGMRQAVMRNVLAQAANTTKAEVLMLERRIPTLDDVLDQVSNVLDDECRAKVERAVHEWARGV
jgi:hypothetical protein